MMRGPIPRLTKHRAVIAAVAVCAGAVVVADACLMLPGVPAQAYLDLGATGQGRVGWLKGTSSTGATGFASATIINSYYAITAGHVVGDLLQTGGALQLGTGGNYFSDQGQVANVAEAIFHPAFQQGAVNTNNPDIAILRLATPLKGITQVEYGNASPFEVVTSYGYGFAFYAGQPTVPRDGFRRGWNAEVGSGSPFFGSDQWYNWTRFAAATNVPVNGKGLGGDSGGGVFNAQGQLVGLNFAQTGNGASVGSTSYLDLAQPEVLAWVQANTTIPPTCGADINCDGGVNSKDLGALLPAWGEPGPTDIDYSGATDSADLGTLLSAWTG
jgi:hypothetical protein